MSRPIGALLKEHAVLAAGIALPVLLVILFTLARALPAQTIADPVYDAVFAVQPYYGGYAFAVKDSKLEVTYTTPKDTYTPPNPPKPELIIYKVSSNTADRVTLTAPELAKGTTSAVIPVKEFADLKLSDKSESPDGYTFRPQGWRGGNSFITEIFSYNNRRTPNALEKSGRIVPIEPLKDQYNVTFIGWVTP